MLGSAGLRVASTARAGRKLRAPAGPVAASKRSFFAIKANNNSLKLSQCVLLANSKDGRIHFYSTSTSTQKDTNNTTVDANATNTQTATTNESTNSPDVVKTPVESAQQQQQQQSEGANTGASGEQAPPPPPEQQQPVWQEPSDWPPASALSTPFFVFSGALAVGFLYMWFAVTEEKLLDVIDFLEGGAPQDRLMQLRRIKRYLLFENMGIEVTQKLASFGIVHAVMSAWWDNNAQVRRSVEQTLCEFSKYDATRKALVQMNAVDTLRSAINRDNYYVVWTLANMSREPLAAAQIARDEYILQSLIQILDDTQSSTKYADYVVLRAAFTTLANVTADPTNCAEMTALCKEKFASALDKLYPMDPIIVQNFVNTRVRLVSACPNDYPILKEQQELAGGISESDRSLSNVGMVHHSLFSLTLGSLYAWYSTRKIAKKFAPLKPTERAWLRTMTWRTPLAALVMSFTWLGLEKLTRFIGTQMDWSNRDTPRKLYLTYLVQIPAYYFAMSWAPFVLVPSLFSFKWREDGPPRYLHLAAMIDKALTDVGVFDPYNMEEHDLMSSANVSDEPAEETKAFIRDSMKTAEFLVTTAQKQQQPRRGWL